MSKKSYKLTYQKLPQALEDNKELLAAYAGAIFGLLYVYRLVKKKF